MKSKKTEFTCGDVFVSVFEAVDIIDTALADSSSDPAHDFNALAAKSMDISAAVSIVSSRLFCCCCCVVVSAFFSNDRSLRCEQFTQ